MKRVVFYSWQSDLPNNTNRGFIQTALEEAAKNIAADLDVEPVIERDTQNVAGSPNIAQTIFKKIDSCDVFVADITLINPASAERRTPNPNVMLELGYAIHAHTDERIILVMNEHYGSVEQLPFDLRMRRTLTYNISPETTEKAPNRHELAKALTKAITDAISTIPAPAPTTNPIDDAITAIETAAPNRALQIRKAMQHLTTQLEKTAPPLFRFGGTDEQLVNAINNTLPTIRDFTRLVNTIASINDVEAARATYKSLSPILERYDNPKGFSGTSDLRDFDYWKFLGQELLVTLIAALLQEERYETINNILNETITVPNIGGRARPAPYDYVNTHIFGLDKLRKLKNRMSYHADLLYQRHATKGREQPADGPLADLLPFDLFAGADYLLYLRGELSPDQPPTGNFEWFPWTSIYLTEAPAFIHNATSAATAERLAHALGLKDTATLKQRLAERAPRLVTAWRQSGHWEHPIFRQDVEAIGTR